MSNALDNDVIAVSAFSSWADLVHSITAHGYRPTLRLDVYEDADDRAAAYRVRRALADGGHPVYPAVAPDEHDPALDLVRVRGLSGWAVFYIGDDHGCIEGDLADDFYTEGRTFIETTRRVLEEIVFRLDDDDRVEDDLVARGTENEPGTPQHAIWERNVRRGWHAMTGRMHAALEGRRYSPWAALAKTKKEMR